MIPELLDKLRGQIQRRPSASLKLIVTQLDTENIENIYDIRNQGTIVAKQARPIARVPLGE